MRQSIATLAAASLVQLYLKRIEAYEQGTHHRKPPASTPALRGEP